MSEYSHVCFAHGLEVNHAIFSAFPLHSTFFSPHFFFSPLRLLPIFEDVLGVVNASSRVSLQNDADYPAHLQRRWIQIPVLRARGI